MNLYLLVLGLFVLWGLAAACLLVGAEADRQ